MSIEVVAVLGSAIGSLISFFFGYSVGRWAKLRAFRRSVLERDVQRIVVNPSSDNPRTFVPESENVKLRELATYALKHIIEAECEAPDRERFRGKPCEDCTEYGSSDCPKCMPGMFDVSGIEVDA